MKLSPITTPVATFRPRRTLERVQQVMAEAAQFATEIGQPVYVYERYKPCFEIIASTEPAPCATVDERIDNLTLGMAHPGGMTVIYGSTLLVLEPELPEPRQQMEPSHR